MLREDIVNFLRVHRIRLDTDSGQHFLVDADVLEMIVAVADLQSNDHVVEVGPGIGVLTRELVKHVKKVTAIEIDQRFPVLLTEFVGSDVLKVVFGNALTTPMPETPYKVVANIPYHITSPLLTHLLIESPVRPTSMTLLMQREVAENICSQESDSILTILVRLFGTPSLVCTVPPKAFLPPPAVDSSVLHVECFEKPKADHATVQRILKLAKLAFAKRRKMLSNTIGEMPGGAEAMKKVGIDSMRRPQTLRVEEWIALEQALRKVREAS